MYMIGLRFWQDGKMIYPKTFSFMTNYEERKSSMRTFIDKKRYDTFEYMLLTPGIAINGEIYEQDIICHIGEEDKTGIVEFKPEKGAFVATINGEDVFIAGELSDYEIIGNTYEAKKNSTHPHSEKENRGEEVLEDENYKNNKKDENAQQEISNKNDSIKEQENKNENQTEPIIKVTPIQKKPLISVNKPTDKLFGKHYYDGSGENLEKQTEHIAETQDSSQEITIDDKNVFTPKTLEEKIETQEEPKVKIYFKGEFFQEYGIGKYGFVITDGEFHKTIINQVRETTQDRLSLIMLIDALRTLKKKCTITIICNVKYPIYPFINSWIDTWVNNNWIGSSGNEIKNKDLWSKLYELTQKHNITWSYDTNITKYAEYRLLEEKFVEKNS